MNDIELTAAYKRLNTKEAYLKAELVALYNERKKLDRLRMEHPPIIWHQVGAPSEYKEGLG